MTNPKIDSDLEMPKITTFKELMAEIAYSWDHGYEFEEDRDPATGEIIGYSLNKLYITPTEVSYKTQRWELEPSIFPMVTKFYHMLIPPADIKPIELKGDCEIHGQRVDAIYLFGTTQRVCFQCLVDEEVTKTT